MVRMRELFCPSCLARDRDRATSSESISPANEPLAAATISDHSSPIGGLNDDEVDQSDQHLAALSFDAKQQSPLSNARDNPQPMNPNSSQQQDIDIQQPSTSRESSSQLSNQQQQQSHRNNESTSVVNQNRFLADEDAQGNAGFVRTRLSYDIISVREPLARVLAERQRQQYQLQRRPMTEHEYNEVYNERGSSCFYEEIAGSTTSSTTYDQIDSASNHNYQALQANAYAVINRADQVQLRRIERDADARNGENNDDGNYDLISGPDYSQPSTSRNVSALESAPTLQQDDKSNGANSDDSNVVQPPAQSIPIYSVINKATKVNNSRFNPDDPPKPPPKNFNYQKQPQASTSRSVPFYEEPRALSDRFQSEHPDSAQSASFENEGENNSPMPPPRPPTAARYHHQNIFNVTHRPLPPPTSENLSSLDENDCDILIERNSKRTDCDFKPDDNGYEFLRPNYYDDQIDVGYEKINDPDQPCPQPVSDNGGYESLQPIYASPAYAGAIEPVNDDDDDE